MSWEHILVNSSKYLSNPELCQTKEGLIELICKGCDFYKEGADEDLECCAFKILKTLFSKKVLTIEELISALKD